MMLVYFTSVMFYDISDVWLLSTIVDNRLLPKFGYFLRIKCWNHIFQSPPEYTSFPEQSAEKLAKKFTNLLSQNSVKVFQCVAGCSTIQVLTRCDQGCSYVGHSLIHHASPRRLHGCGDDVFDQREWRALAAPVVECKPACENPLHKASRVLCF